MDESEAFGRAASALAEAGRAVGAWWHEGATVPCFRVNSCTREEVKNLFADAVNEHDSGWTRAYRGFAVIFRGHDVRVVLTEPDAFPARSVWHSGYLVGVDLRPAKEWPICALLRLEHRAGDYTAVVGLLEATRPREDADDGLRAWAYVAHAPASAYADADPDSDLIQPLE